MKRKFKKIMLLPLALLITSCGGTNNTLPNVEFKDIYVNINTENLSQNYDGYYIFTIGQTGKFEASLINDEAGVNFSSNDPSIIEVKTDGTFTAKEIGTSIITASSITDPTKTSKINVLINGVEDVSITLGENPSSIKVGETFKVAATGSSNAGTLMYSSSNSAVLTVTDDGTVEAIQTSREPVYIVVSAKNNRNVSESFSVNVVASDDGTTILTDKVPTAGENSEYRLIYEDTFSGNALNKHNWEVQEGDGTAYGLASGWGNQELQYYLDRNIRVENGELVIALKNEKSDYVYSSPDSYTSGRIRSLFNGTYGRVEARLSVDSGNGIWPAFWMLPQDTSTETSYGGWPNSGEIDIFEGRGRLPWMVYSTLHYADHNGGATADGISYAFEDDSTDTTQKHTYALEWEEGNITFLVDDVETISINEWTISDGTGSFPAPFDKNFYVILNLAVGGTYDAGYVPDAENIPAFMNVEYVRWYKKI